jgi:SsrA-binding protein
MKRPSIMVVATNRKAHLNYEILDRYEAGLVLSGPEVKSLREGKVSINEAYARCYQDEIWLHNADIAPYQPAAQVHQPKRTRKLLLRRNQINRLKMKTQERGLTLVPLSLYFKDGWAKIELALARGRKRYDKREVIKKREVQREIRKRMFRKG